MKLLTLKNTGSITALLLVSAIVSANNNVSKVEAALPTSAKEATTFSQLIEKFDEDKNGALSLPELTESKHEMLTAAFSKVDTNGDKNINEQEFDKFMALANSHKDQLMKKF